MQIYCTMLIRPFPATMPLSEHLSNPAVFCSRSKDLYPYYEQQGAYRTSLQPCFCVYRIEDHARQQKSTGIVALTDMHDYVHGRIKKHERTIPLREEQQLNLIETWKGLIKPVLLTYPPAPAIADWIAEMTGQYAEALSVPFEDEQQTHTFWLIDRAEDIARLQVLFRGHLRQAYIADGHHRATALYRLHQKEAEKDFPGMFCAFFDTDQLRIGAFHRVAVLSGDFAATGAVEALLRRFFEVYPLREAALPGKIHEMTLFYQERWMRLVWKKDVLEAMSIHYTPDTVLLDTWLLDSLLKGHLEGMEQPLTHDPLRYVEGKGNAEKLKEICTTPLHLAFALHPVAFSDFQQVSDTDGIMPPKSTFFEPRLKSGLVVLKMKTP